MSKAFTLMELLIVVTLLSLLSITLIVIINPREQQRKASDTKTFQLLSEIYRSALRYNTDLDKTYSPEPLTAVLLNSDSGLAFLSLLSTAGEISSRTQKDASLPRIFLTTALPDHLALCFQPLSAMYQQNPQTIYDSSANAQENCPGPLCYYCLTTDPLSPLAASTPTPTGIPSLPLDPCADFNPEYPNYPWTSNFSTRWAIYGCTNYTVADFGCSSSCPSGSRLLRKSYYTTDPLSYFNCSSHSSITTENYCIAEPYANCTNHPLPSSDMDFNWGCTDPRRPNAWL